MKQTENKEDKKYWLIVKKNKENSSVVVHNFLNTLLGRRTIYSTYFFREHLHVFSLNNLHRSNLLRIVINENERDLFESEHYYTFAGLRSKTPPIPLVIIPCDFFRTSGIYDERYKTFKNNFKEHAIVLNDKVTEKDRYLKKRKEKIEENPFRKMKVVDLFDYKVGDLIKRTDVVGSYALNWVISRITDKSVTVTQIKPRIDRVNNIKGSEFYEQRPKGHSFYDRIKYCDETKDFFHNTYSENRTSLSMKGELKIEKSDGYVYLHRF